MLEKKLQVKENEFRNLINYLEDRISEYPQGSLRIANESRGISYYHYKGKQALKKGEAIAAYIKKQDFQLAKSLAQKSYEKKVLKWAKDCYEKLRILTGCYDDHAVDHFYAALSEERKKLVTPLEDSMAGRLAKWEAVEYQGKNISENFPLILTEKGEQVRSKSEKILADKFLLHRIPYKYEMPLHLAGFGTVYPDFTLLNVHTGEVLYWEHFGMMDCPEYAEKTVKKIETYVKNGIFPGKQLLMTFESQKSGLNMMTAEALIQEYLI